MQEYDDSYAFEEESKGYVHILLFAFHPSHMFGHITNSNDDKK